MRSGFLVCVTLAVLSGTIVGQDTQPAGVRIERQHAAIAIRLPEDFKAQPTTDLFEIIRAVKEQDGKAVFAATLAAFPAPAGATVEELAEAKLDALRKKLAIRHLEILTEVQMPVASVTGSAKLLSYTFRGAKTVAAQVYFINSPREDVHVGYILTVEAPAEKQSQLLPVLASLVKSVEFTGIKHPFEMPIYELDEAITDPRGYRMRPPAGWFAEQTPSGLLLAQADYLQFGQPAPAIRVLVSKLAKDMPAEEASSKTLQRLLKVAPQQGMTVEILSEAATTLANQDAYQFVVRQTVPRRDGSMNSILIAQRTICTPGDMVVPAQSYNLSIVCPGADQRQIMSIMSAIVRGFELITPTVEQTTAPAEDLAAPAEE